MAVGWIRWGPSLRMTVERNGRVGTGGVVGWQQWGRPGDGGWGGGGAQPWGRPEGDPNLTPNPTGAVRSFGSAKARYDFCARDRTELTLREGDIIRVLSKKGHPGWWKGEIYGRVRPLPKPHRPPLPNPTIAPHGLTPYPSSPRSDGSPLTTWRRITRSIADRRTPKCPPTLYPPPRTLCPTL